MMAASQLDARSTGITSTAHDAAVWSMSMIVVAAAIAAYRYFTLPSGSQCQLRWARYGNPTAALGGGLCNGVHVVAEPRHPLFCMVMAASFRQGCTRSMHIAVQDDRS